MRRAKDEKLPLQRSATEPALNLADLHSDQTPIGKLKKSKTRLSTLPKEVEESYTENVDAKPIWRRLADKLKGSSPTKEAPENLPELPDAPEVEELLKPLDDQELEKQLEQIERPVEDLEKF